MFGQVRLSGTSAVFEGVFENERLFHRINNRDGPFVLDRSWPGVRGFNGRYEKLTLVQSRKVNPEGQIEKVRISFGRGEPVNSRCLWPRIYITRCPGLTQAGALPFLAVNAQHAWHQDLCECLPATDLSLD